MIKTFTVTCSMDERSIPQFLALLKYMEYLGHTGSTRTIQFFCDGDGEFRPKFNWDTTGMPEPDKYLKTSIVKPEIAESQWLESVYVRRDETVRQLKAMLTRLIVQCDGAQAYVEGEAEPRIAEEFNEVLSQAHYLVNSV